MGELSFLGNVGAAAAICGMMMYLVGTGARYEGNLLRGALAGLGFGILMLLPLTALVPFILWPTPMPVSLRIFWGFGVVMFEVGLWFKMLECRGGAARKRERNEGDEAPFPVGTRSVEA